jgi:hypothetical protein
MAEWVQVLGKDPVYTGSTLSMFIRSDTIWKVHPVHAVVKDGEAFACTEGFANGQILSYILTDLQGNRYSCGKKDELAKLGLSIGVEKEVFGFGAWALLNEKAKAEKK